MLHALYYYFQVIGAQRKRFIIGLVILFVLRLYQLVPPFLVGAIAESLAKNEPSHGYLRTICLIFGGSFTAVSIIRLQTKRYLDTIRIKNDLEIRQHSFRSLLHRTDGQDSSDSGAYIQTLNQGLLGIFEFGTILQNEGMTAVVLSIGLTALLAFYSGPLAMMSFLYIIFFIAQTIYFRDRIQNLEREKLKVQAQTSATIVNTIEGSRTLRAFKLSQKIQSRTESKNEALYKIDRERQKNGFLLWQIFQSSNGLFLGITVWQICTLASQKAITITLTITLIGYVQAFVSAFIDILAVWSRLQTSIAGLNCLESIYKPTQQTRINNETKISNNTWRILSVNKVSLFYSGAHKAALKDKSCNITRGNHTLIKGASGSGKSTLAKVLAGILSPNSGTVTLDDAPVSADELSHLVSFAMQDVQIFALSLKENITLCTEISQEKLDEVISICRLDSLIEKMPQGIDTILGNNGWLLSGGEMLRLSLARALLREPSILILDETTSMIEPSLEVKILDDIRALYPQMTLILISHQDHPREWISNQIVF